MSNPYTTQTISGFDASPPSDDGSINASNEVEWQKHLDKIGTPCKDLAEDMNTELLSAFGLIFGQNISTHSSNYTVLAADQGKLPATAGAGFPLAIINNGSGVVTVDANGAETINGVTDIDLSPGKFIILTCNNALWVGANTGGAGQIVQTIEATPNTTATLVTTAIPLDNTIPQNTEGTEVITVSITPKSTTSRLRICCSFDMVQAQSTENAIISLFQDSTSDAISATVVYVDFPAQASLYHEMVAGTISSTTFKIRLGPTVVNNLSYNRTTGLNPAFGGSLAAVRLRVEEISG